MSRFQSRNKIESIIIASTNSNARSSRKANNSPPPMEHINGHAATTNGNSRSSKRRRQSDVELTNGTSSKRAMLKETSESSSNRKYNNNNVSNTNGSRQFNNNNNNNNNKKHSVNPATKQTKTTSSMEFSYRNNDISTIPTPPSPASPASPPPTSSAAAARGNQVPEVVCISDGESEEDIDHDTEEDDEPEIDETPTTSNNNRQPNNKSAPPTAGGSASPPSYAMPTSNSVPIDLENEVHRNDLEHVTDLRSYVNLLKEERVSLDDFLIIRVLGTGAYGRVFLVRKLTKHDSGKLYAMKVLNKITVVQKRKTAEHTKTERVVLEAVQRSPFLVGLHYAFQSSSKLYLVLDFANGGELFTHLYHAEHFEESRVRIYIAEVVLALEQLHQLGIVYRDIKLENILLDGDGHIVLSDFGLSKILSRENEYRAHSFCGTLEYMAPEIIRTGPPGHDSAVDWWSVGVLTFELLTGASPFATSDGQSLQSEISRRIQKEQPLIPSSFSSHARDFVLKMLEKNPKRRLGGNHRDATEIKNHPFFRGINWVELRTKRRKAPYKPTLNGEDDVQNFSNEFTDQLPEDPECESPPENIRLFRGYTYVAPEHLERMRRDNLCEIEYCNVDALRSIPSRPDDLELGRRVSHGSFGNCFYVIDGSSPAQYCAKVVPLSKYRASELDALTSCATDSHNPHHIVSYHGAYRDKCEVWIITEYLSGKELSTALQAQEFDESACRNIFLQLLDALKFVHSKHFIHGDVKPENVLFVDQDRSSVRLLDFGSASYNSRFQTWKDHPRYTLDYAPPELLKDRAVVSYSPAVDIYGLGATLYTMLVGHAPYRSFHGDNDHSIEAHHKLRRRITKEAFNQRSKRWCNASPQFRELVEWCLQRDPANRPKFNDLIRCAWLQHGLGFELTITPMPEQEVVDLSDDTMEEEPIAAPAEEQMEVTATSIESPSSPVTAERTEEPKSSDLMKNLFNAADFEDHSDFYGFDERAPPLRLPSEYYMEIPLPLLECEVAEPEPPAQTLPDVAADQTTNDATQRKRTRQQQRTRKVVGTAVEPEDTKAGLYLLMQQVTPPVDVVPPSVDIVPLPLSVFMARRAERATSPLEEMFSGFRKQEATWRKSRASWRQFCSLLNGVQQVLKQRFKRQRIYCAPAINIKSERIDYAYEKPLVFPRPKPRAARQPKPAKIPRAPTRVQPARARALHQKYVFE
ncbi:chromosomal serine/threonine-protein kinase JIL-1 [Drosophila busckii]|uniref:chromosomal serine/threonine-protein kinase JIL-1 n=1 Tax=Drosophila busckii TaxID=30019 RepID=UPI00083EB1E3|nr:chromosomal serine/threonine-protein kinase JIL-1 [Drosophila busckii]